MEDIYHWLYDHYALPQLKGLESGQNVVLGQLAGHLSLSPEDGCTLRNAAENIRLQWGTEVFALGVQFGMDMAEPHTPDEDFAWLIDFLP